MDYLLQHICTVAQIKSGKQSVGYAVFIRGFPVALEILSFIFFQSTGSKCQGYGLVTYDSGELFLYPQLSSGFMVPYRLNRSDDVGGSEGRSIAFLLASALFSVVLTTSMVYMY